MKICSVVCRTSRLVPLMLFIGIQVAHASEWNYLQYSQIKWREYKAATFAEASNANKPLYIFIYANWCHWCKKFETETLETKDIRFLLQRETIPVAIEYDKQKELARKLGAKMVPTSILSAPDGKKLLRFHGFLNAKELSEVLQRTLSAWRKGELPVEEFGDDTTCCIIQE